MRQYGVSKCNNTEPAKNDNTKPAKCDTELAKSDNTELANTMIQSQQMQQYGVRKKSKNQ